jgi:hypothetical protein
VDEDEGAEDALKVGIRTTERLVADERAFIAVLWPASEQAKAILSTRPTSISIIRFMNQIVRFRE